MFRSIRWTLQLWHAGLLAVVLVGFGTASYFGISRGRFEQLDAELARSVQVLVTGFHLPKRPEPSTTGSTTRGTDEPPHGHRHELTADDFEVPTSLVQRFEAGGVGSDYYVIWNAEGKVMKASVAAGDVPYAGVRPEWPPRPQIPGPPRIRQRVEFREAFTDGPFGTRILIGTSIRPVQAELRRLAFLLAGIGAGVLVLGLVGGWLVSLRAVRPIQAITSVAQDISASNLSRRIDAAEVQSELGSLAGVLNEMFDRLDAAFQQQIRFTADASHELRTPLSVIHTHAQLALTRERTAEEYRKAIETCLRASSRMKDLVDSLLLLAGADAGRLRLDRKPFDLRDVAEGCISMVAALAEKKHVVIEANLKSAELTADASRIAQVTTNLLTNAIRYNREGGHVHVSVGVDGPDAALTIADTGLGIPEESQPHLFERFYRVDKARSREEGGSGLGLAICKSIVEAHGGTITFRSEVGRGTTFVVRLPRADSTATG